MSLPEANSSSGQDRSQETGRDTSLNHVFLQNKLKAIISRNGLISFLEESFL